MTTTVSNGLFTVMLNTAGQFPAWVFDGRASWIQTAVRCPSGVGSYTTFSTRQQLSTAPLAAGLAPNSQLRSENANPGNSALMINAPPVNSANPSALESHADPSGYAGVIYPLGVWGDSSTGFARLSQSPFLSGFRRERGLAYREIRSSLFNKSAWSRSFLSTLIFAVYFCRY